MARRPNYTVRLGRPAGSRPARIVKRHPNKKHHPPDVGGVPEWVPEGAKIHIDLVGGTPQGRAWTEADGIVAVDTLLGTDAARPASEYDPAALATDGLGVAGSNPDEVAFIGAARTALIAGATTVFIWRFGSSVYLFDLFSTDGADYIEVQSRTSVELGNVSIESANGDLEVEIDDSIPSPSTDNGIAFTLSSTRADLAVNGLPAASGEMTETDWPPGNPMTVATFSAGDASFVRSITIYDLFPDTTGLSALSAVL